MVAISVRKCDVLVWIGGDVTQYEYVKYVLPECEPAETFTGVAYLAKVLEPSKLVVVIPETLFEGNHCESYRALLEAKSGFEGSRIAVSRGGKYVDLTCRDELVHELLRKGFDCYVVPHPGIASPLRVEVRVEDGVRVAYVSRSDASSYEGYNFTTLFALIYLALSRYASAGYRSICVDITHGTNVIVSAMLLASALLPLVHDVEVRFFAAPVMGRPGRGTLVEYLELSEALEVVKELIAGAQAWKMIDERLLPINYFDKLGKLLGERYRGTYGRVKRVLHRAEELLWGLRSGQVPILRDRVEELSRDLREAKRLLREMISRELPVDSSLHPDEWRRHSSEPPWAIVASVVLDLTSKLVERLRAERNADFVAKAIDLLLEASYLDKVLSVGREWLVALCLWSALKEGEVRVGDNEWQSVEERLRSIAIFDKSRQLRNRLMHGRVSREENAKLILGSDIEVVSPSGKPLEVIKKSDLENVANDLAKYIRDAKCPLNAPP